MFYLWIWFVYANTGAEKSTYFSLPPLPESPHPDWERRFTRKRLVWKLKLASVNFLSVNSEYHEKCGSFNPDRVLIFHYMVTDWIWRFHYNSWSIFKWWSQRYAWVVCFESELNYDNLAAQCFPPPPASVMIYWTVFEVKIFLKHYKI